VKIDNSVKSLGGVASGARKDGTKPSVARQPAAQSSDVALSPLSSRLQEIESAMATTPVVDSDRVNAIQQAISQGAFQIDSSKIANGLISSVREMLAAQK
jgi:negative regulator of flagellin synthesis FlgM